MAKVKGYVYPHNEVIRLYVNRYNYTLTYGEGNGIKVVYDYYREQAAFCHYYLNDYVKDLPVAPSSNNPAMKACSLEMFLKIHLFIEAVKPLDETKTQIIHRAIFKHMAFEEISYWHSKALTSRQGMKAFRILFSHPYAVDKNEAV